MDFLFRGEPIKAISIEEAPVLFRVIRHLVRDGDWKRAKLPRFFIGGVYLWDIAIREILHTIQFRFQAQGCI